MMGLGSIFSEGNKKRPEDKAAEAEQGLRTARQQISTARPSGVSEGMGMVGKAMAAKGMAKRAQRKKQRVAQPGRAF